MAKRKKENRVSNYTFAAKRKYNKNVFGCSIDCITGDVLKISLWDDNDKIQNIDIPIKDLLLKKAIDTKKLTLLINKYLKNGKSNREQKGF